ncbi:unnamed protein product [Euphydryas editha]|uniref:Uncharacterized protein n=1 Tax=Euphydryas editha TaxID=104508 RepID=A0AAU9UI66_EUPED|nr:unnamed protein product [Euphydryas editha]
MPPRQTYPPEKFSSAMEATRNGMLIERLAERLELLKVHYKIGSIYVSQKTQEKWVPFLNKAKEAALMDCCQKLTKCGFPSKTDNLLNTVQGIVKAKTRKKWLKSFFRRNSSLSIRTAEEISKRRAVITREYIKKWF